jgi:hypothetical protein
VDGGQADVLVATTIACDEVLVEQLVVIHTCFAVGPPG